MEEWRDIEGFEGLYQVSNMGNVRGLDRYLLVERYGKTYKRVQKGTILKKQKNKDGYEEVLLHKGTRDDLHPKMVAKLVALAFLPNPENKPCVDHINTIKDDNRAFNLRWVSYKENSSNPLTVEHHKGTHSVPHIPARKPVIQFTKDGEFIKMWGCVQDAASELGISKSNIRSVASHYPHAHTAGGYRWEYA